MCACLSKQRVLTVVLALLLLLWRAHQGGEPHLRRWVPVWRWLFAGGVVRVPDLCCVSTCRYPFAITGVNITTTMAGLVGLT